MVGFLQIIEQRRVNDSIFLEWTGRSFNQSIFIAQLAGAPASHIGFGTEIGIICCANASSA